ncbi:MAG: hypothetical protein M3Y87_29665, partial [Myxococcota bacterium]|nr:hypothetical protein [Myxococcota bacterium]
DAARDAGGDDAGDDAGATCPMIAADTYAVVEVAATSCVFSAGAQVIVSAGTTACDWTAASVAESVIDGTFTVAADATIAGSVRVAGAMEPVACTGAFDATTRQLTFTCPTDCVITLAPTTATM